MGLVVKIGRKTKPESLSKELSKLSAKRKKKKYASLADFYGALPNAYEDGLIYQKKQRDEWQ